MEMTTPLVNATLAKKVVRVRDKNQITLPSVILAGLPICPGDFVELTRTAHGVLEIRPVTLVPLVNTPAAEASVAEAERDMAKGDYQTFSSARQYADALKTRRKKREKVAQAAGQAATSAADAAGSAAAAAGTAATNAAGTAADAANSAGQAAGQAATNAADAAKAASDSSAPPKQ